ncbi:2Fe-2S iron-sulfur cluster-binding protein [Chromobacterium haemolyticum]|nr:2Fe-2S iron-sulfur cluster-binding protein [Chromobacterium haemolyticum]
MTAQVKVLPSGHTFGVEPHETVLEAALRQGVGLPYGCRDGACGACKGKVVDGEVSQDGFQEKALTEAERAQGLALFCCARPLRATSPSRLAKWLERAISRSRPCRAV